eukprot:PhM_4_TR18783/c0_g1_i1/m.21415
MSRFHYDANSNAFQVVTATSAKGQTPTRKKNRSFSSSTSTAGRVGFGSGTPRWSLKQKDDNEHNLEETMGPQDRTLSTPSRRLMGKPTISSSKRVSSSSSFATPARNTNVFPFPSSTASDQSHRNANNKNNVVTQNNDVDDSVNCTRHRDTSFRNFSPNSRRLIAASSKNNNNVLSGRREVTHVEVSPEEQRSKGLSQDTKDNTRIHQQKHNREELQSAVDRLNKEHDMILALQKVLHRKREEAGLGPDEGEVVDDAAKGTAATSTPASHNVKPKKTESRSSTPLRVGGTSKGREKPVVTTYPQQKSATIITPSSSSSFGSSSVLATAKFPLSNHRQAVPTTSSNTASNPRRANVRRGDQATTATKHHNSNNKVELNLTDDVVMDHHDEEEEEEIDDLDVIEFARSFLSGGESHRQTIVKNSDSDTPNGGKHQMFVPVREQQQHEQKEQTSFGSRRPSINKSTNNTIHTQRRRSTGVVDTPPPPPPPTAGIISAADRASALDVADGRFDDPLLRGHITEHKAVGKSVDAILGNVLQQQNQQLLLRGGGSSRGCSSASTSTLYRMNSYNNNTSDGEFDSGVSSSLDDHQQQQVLWAEYTDFVNRVVHRQQEGDSLNTNPKSVTSHTTTSRRRPGDSYLSIIGGGGRTTSMATPQQNLSPFSGRRVHTNLRPHNASAHRRRAVMPDYPTPGPGEYDTPLKVDSVLSSGTRQGGYSFGLSPRSLRFPNADADKFLNRSGLR